MTNLKRQTHEICHSFLLSLLFLLYKSAGCKWGGANRILNWSKDKIVELFSVYRTYTWKTLCFITQWKFKKKIQILRFLAVSQKYKKLNLKKNWEKTRSRSLLARKIKKIKYIVNLSVVRNRDFSLKFFFSKCPDLDPINYFWLPKLLFLWRKQILFYQTNFWSDFYHF